MELHQKEAIILNLIAAIFQQILQENPILPISVKSRGGAEISDRLEDYFVQIAENKERIEDVSGAQKGKTKSPYDLKFIYRFLSGDSELVWIDIKASNAAYQNSNPDMGTYKKFLKFFGEGNYFAVYCQLAYRSEGNGLKFVETPQGQLFNVFLLKNINHRFRIQPNDQLQVNHAAPPEPRSLMEFIELLQEKVQESLVRRQKNIEKQLNTLTAEFDSVKQSVRNTLSR